MALATQCPHCHTTFRVASDQLKLRGGIVRCGACQSIFDGNAHLIDLDAQAAAKDAGAPSAAPPPEAPAAAPAPEAEAQPVHTFDFTHTFDPLGILPKVDATSAADASAAPASVQPAPPAQAVQAPGGPQVWRTAARPAPVDAAAAADVTAADVAADDVAADDVAPSGATQADGAPRPDPAASAAAGAELPGTTAMPLPEPAVSDADAAPAYAPPGRIEPRLEGLQGPAADAAPEPAPAHEAPAVQDAAPAVPPAEPAAPRSYAPASRIEPHFDLPVDEELVAQPLRHDDGVDDDMAGDVPDAGAGEPRADVSDPVSDPVPAPAPGTDPAPAAAAAEAAVPAARPEPPAPTPAIVPPAGDVPPAALPLRASAGGALPAPPPVPPRPVRSKAAEARARRSSLKPTRIEAPRLRVPQDDVDEPEFVKRSRRQERTGKTRRLLMGAGTALLLVLLAGQSVHAFRNVLAARHPALKPALAAACTLAGCRVELPAQVDNLAIETGELATLGPGTYTLNTLLRNQGSLVQAWPSIELELTDDANKPVLRRVFAPADYLPQGVSVAAGFGARTEQPVRLHFALADIQPSDYHLFVFYP